jgi:hypothetical protein
MPVQRMPAGDSRLDAAPVSLRSTNALLPIAV